MADDGEHDRALGREDFGGALRPMLAPRLMAALPCRVWDEAGWAGIRRGLLSRGMDDRWNALTEGTDVYLHRSWTGYCIYHAAFTRLPGGRYGIEAAWVESDPERYRAGGAAFEALTLELTLGLLTPDSEERYLRVRDAWREQLSARMD